MRGTVVEIGFEGDRLLASAGCGRITARFEFRRGRLRTSDLKSSGKTCQGRLAKQQEWLVGFLGKPAWAHTFEDGGALLTGFRNDYMEMVESGESLDPKDRLERDLWEMDRIERGEIGLELPVDGKVPRLMFTDGTAVFWRACNLSEEPASWDDSTIETEGGMEVSSGCPQPHKVWAEALADVLNGPVRYSFRGHDLVLAGDGRSIVLTPR